MKSTKLLVVLVLILSLLLAWNVLAKSKGKAPDKESLLKFERVRSEGAGGIYFRAQVPGGWLIVYDGKGATFIPDPEHRWGATAE